MAKMIALFGSFSVKQLRVLKKAGFAGLSTDAPTEADLYAAAKEAGLQVVRRRAAWEVLDHQYSEPTTGVGRDGNPREYNRSGGYTRDAIIVGECYAVLVGSGVSGARLDLIKHVAEDSHRPMRFVEPETVVEEYSFEQAQAELAALPF